MNGREFFLKYSEQISLLAKIIGMMPERIRRKRFESLCYKNGSIAMFKRYLYFKSLTKRCGYNVAIFPGVYFENIDNLVVGSNVSIHQMCYIDAEGGLEIGDDVSIAHRCSILSSNHKYSRSDDPIKYQGMELVQTVIKNDVWIGCGSVILAGANIDTGCVIGANSTVTKHIPRDSVAVGTPAKIIKNRI